MVSRFLLILILSLSQYSCAQEEQYIRPGLLAASLTYSPSTMLNHQRNHFYISGFAEYFLGSKLSFRGDSYLFRTDSFTNAFMTDALRSYFGVAYHVNKGNWDGYVGFQPGITMMNRKVYPTKIQPSAAVRIGTSYYVWKYFHFFANLTYVRSKVVVPDVGSAQADELIFSAGLGFQIQTKKK